MDRQEMIEKRDPEKIMKWLAPYIGHEHLGFDLKDPEVSLEKYLAVAPDVYVMSSMLQAILMTAAEQKMLAEYGKEALPFKPYSELTAEEKTPEELKRREIFIAGMRAGRDTAMIEMANRITMAARMQLDDYRLENSEYDPALVVDERDLPEVG